MKMDPVVSWELAGEFPLNNGDSSGSMLIYHLVMTNIAMENHGKSPFLISKPSISMGHLYHGYVSHDQRVQAFLFFHMRTW